MELHLVTAITLRPVTSVLEDPTAEIRHLDSVALPLDTATDQDPHVAVRLTVEAVEIVPVHPRTETETETEDSDESGIGRRKRILNRARKGTKLLRIRLVKKMVTKIAPVVHKKMASVRSIVLKRQKGVAGHLLEHRRDRRSGVVAVIPELLLEDEIALDHRTVHRVAGTTGLHLLKGLGTVGEMIQSDVDAMIMKIVAQLRNQSHPHPRLEQVLWTHKHLIPLPEEATAID
jgi:hypothetical protein